MPQRKRKKISLSDLHEETPLQKKRERERDRGRERELCTAHYVRKPQRRCARSLI
jgi:hypothetical protein